ncbi:MAG TPA: helix-turn-helix transcriptional regulator [Candidatus Obscuribacterales bacterium]
MTDKPKPIRDAFPIGPVLYERRRQLELSQEDVAKRCGLHRTYISDVERGARSISLGTLKQLSNALEMDVWQLMLAAEQQTEDKKEATAKPAQNVMREADHEIDHRLTKGLPDA